MLLLLLQQFLNVAFFYFIFLFFCLIMADLFHHKLLPHMKLIITNIYNSAVKNVQFFINAGAYGVWQGSLPIKFID